MQRPSPAFATLTAFWILYVIVAAITLYQALSPLKRNLLLILGGMGAILVIGTLALLRRTRSSSPPAAKLE
jgi:hypothetical protein